MKCIVPGPNVKVLGRAIHSLAKLGNEIYLEFTNNQLSLRTANASKTAYATFQFSIDFFSYFASDIDESSEGSLKCQISMKSSLAAFRSPATLDRMVESLEINLNQNCDKLIFLLKFKKGFLKTFNIPVIECETLQAYYLKDDASNKLLVQPKVVCDILSNFQNNHLEITWKVTKDKLIVKNYSENDAEYSGVRTEIKVEKDEFDEFKIQNETEITFCMKELRAVLLFSDNVGLPLTVYFITSSKPIVFSVKGEVFEADIVVSTLTGSDYVDSQSVRSQNGENPQNPEQMEENTEHEKLNHLDNDEFFCNMELDEQELMKCAQESSSTKKGSDSVRKKKEKLKHVFQRCFNNEKFDVKKLPGYDVVLASDSDSGSDKEE